MTRTPAITVVMIAMKTGNQFEFEIENLLNQTFSDFEVIVVANGRVADIRPESRLLADRRVQLRFHTSKVLSKFELYNIGIEASIGKYLCMLEPNSTWLPDRLDVQFKYLEDHPRIGCIGSTIAHGINYKRKSSQTFLSHGVIKALLLKDNCTIPSSLMFRTSYLKKFELRYNPSLHQAADYDFISRSSRHFPIRTIDTIVVQNTLKDIDNDSHAIAEDIILADKVRIKALDRFSIQPTQDQTALHLRLMRNEYLADDELEVAIDWFNYLLEINSKIKLYSQECLLRVFRSTILTSLQKNKLGGWSIEKELLAFIGKILLDGKQILEFGSGTGTEALLKKYEVTSIEHDLNYAKTRGKNHLCIYAPIKNAWYERNSVKNALKRAPDLLLIDGPPGPLRIGILDNLDLFTNINIPIIFDDIDRGIDRQIMTKFCSALKYGYQIHRGQEKQFAYCIKH
jgi:glycosyltransferase involved in cell wall biosynthesis